MSQWAIVGLLAAMAVTPALGASNAQNCAVLAQPFGKVEGNFTALAQSLEQLNETQAIAIMDEPVKGDFEELQQKRQAAIGPLRDFVAALHKLNADLAACSGAQP